MTVLKLEQLAVSDLVLDRVLNPTNNPELNKARPMDLFHACGIIPDMFADACVVSDNPETTLSVAGGSTVIKRDKIAEQVADESLTKLDVVANTMDLLYGYGGFGAYPYVGEVLPTGEYRSNSDDDDLPPLAQFTYVDSGLVCYVYEYSIIAVKDTATGQAKIARFD